MKIKTRLVLLLASILFFINLLTFFTIFSLSSKFRRDQFYERLVNKAQNTAKLLVDVEEIDAELLRIIDENTISLPQEQVVVFDIRGNIRYQSNATNVLGIKYTIFKNVESTGYQEFQEGNLEGVGVRYKGGTQSVIVVAIALDQYGLGKINYLRWVLVLLFPATLLLVFWVLEVFVKKAFIPFDVIVSDVNNITATSLDKRLLLNDSEDELNMLARTFNAMLDRIETAFITQKGFVSYASHELRTPLTAILGQIEVALNAKRSSEEYEGLLHSINEEILKLKRLTNGILRLFQLQSSGLKMNFSPTRIDEVVFSAVSQVRSEGYQNIEVSFEEIPSSDLLVTINGNEELLQLALSNVIENACKFSDGKHVGVILALLDHKIKIEIKDSGPGLNTDDRLKVFQPFYRTAESQQKKGYGLGLAIVKQILDIHDAEYNFENNQDSVGSTFSIIFQITI